MADARAKREFALADEAATLALGAWLAQILPKETLKKAASGMQRKAFGAQRPRKRAEGEVPVQANRSEAAEANTAQRGDAPAQQLIQHFPKDLSPAAVIYLEGDLGAGKTTLVRGLLQKLHPGQAVKSPTFTLVEPYVISGLHLYHFDFYRFNFPEEFLDAGLDEYFAAEGVCLVEWPARAAPYLPAPDLCIRLKHAGSGRLASVEAASERGRRWLASSPALPAVSSSAPAAPS
ncbi:tRNA (adenosine(37)-N6)-threonylcarbamoyltransferase complex ATPase subunit type 1 TsaE [Sulfuricystis multivorans]|uniref:tRNA (adenosine(37)-N6)-threonylcarbamoyltransferase complex ATPase subunit type 1 TsaE n=1 Tax=Sulfuricystis multivorans TaxID=2211108 RepID=UPI0024DFA707|nr:tRNA (adenosine(37)-N6)-threonylcarbamoyltransferase complex ATPase subunit type 1 TsaE [Sulfuricystis multivorans]